MAGASCFKRWLGLRLRHTSGLNRNGNMLQLQMDNKRTIRIGPQRGEKTGERRRRIKGRRQEREESWRRRTSALAARRSWTPSRKVQRKLGAFSAEHDSLYFRKDPQQGCKDASRKAHAKRYRPKSVQWSTTWSLGELKFNVKCCRGSNV